MSTRTSHRRSARTSAAQTRWLAARVLEAQRVYRETESHADRQTYEQAVVAWNRERSA